MESSTFIILIPAIQERTPLPKTVDNSKVEPAQRVAHDALEKVIGRTLYTELQTAIDADSTLASESDLKTLVLWYIEPYVAWLTWYHAIDFIQFQTNKTGHHKTTSDNHESVSVEELRLMKGDAKPIVDDYLDKLIAFLDDKAGTVDKYSSYNTTTTQEERITKGHFAGLYMPNKRAQIYERSGRKPNIFYPNDDC